MNQITISIVSSIVTSSILGFILRSVIKMKIDRFLDQQRVKDKEILLKLENYFKIEEEKKKVINDFLKTLLPAKMKEYNDLLFYVSTLRNKCKEILEMGKILNNNEQEAFNVIIAEFEKKLYLLKPELELDELWKSIHVFKNSIITYINDPTKINYSIIESNFCAIFTEHVNYRRKKELYI